MFERMEISESIYEGVVEPLYKNPTRADANCADNSKKKEYAFSSTQPETIVSPEKNRKWYVNHPKDRSKQTCLIHGSIHSSDECKILEDFGNIYVKISPTKPTKLWKTAKEL